MIIVKGKFVICHSTARSPSFCKLFSDTVHKRQIEILSVCVCVPSSRSFKESKVKAKGQGRCTMCPEPQGEGHPFQT